jgi:SAM-dependent methyltransferase
MTELNRRDRRERWDDRHQHGEIESGEPDATLVAEVSGLTPATALDVACGSGTNAIWLAQAGWQVTGVDWSAVALEKARARADEAGVSVEWIEADLLAWMPPPSAFDLVTVLYLHLAPDERRVVYPAAARAVAPGGSLLVVGHDRENLGRGPGPQDPERLFTAAKLGVELETGFRDLVIEKALVLRRGSARDQGPVDAVLRMRRVAG